MIPVPSMRPAIERLQAELVKLPQLEPKTDHYFADGVYLRTVWSPAGSVIVGKVHKTEHLYAVLSGKVRVTMDTGVIELDATKDGPQILTCPIGTKRAVYILEDAWRMNVHRNVDNVKEIEALEELLVESDPQCQYLPGNKLRALA